MRMKMRVLRCHRFLQRFGRRFRHYRGRWRDWSDCGFRGDYRDWFRGCGFHDCESCGHGRGKPCYIRLEIAQNLEQIGDRPVDLRGVR